MAKPIEDPTREWSILLWMDFVGLQDAWALKVVFTHFDGEAEKHSRQKIQKEHNDVT